MRMLLTALTVAGMIAAPALAAEPVAGNWRTQAGDTARIASCGDAYCITLISGKFKGKEIGKFTGSGGHYSGEITDPNNDRTYSGTAETSGQSMKLTGCALKIFCKSQTWTRQ